MNSEEALCHLGILVECGKKTFIDSCRKDGIRDPEETATREINKILLIVSEEKLFSDKDFSVSLRLGLLRLFGEDRKNFESNFLKRLSEIFPPKLAEKLHRHAIELEVKEVKETANLGKEEADRKLQEEVNLLYEKRRKIMLSVVNNIMKNEGRLRFNERRPPTTGTESILVPCPKCGLEKRCFKNTKRFRCQCGYENPNYCYGSAP